jgi:hypothetical protein
MLTFSKSEVSRTHLKCKREAEENVLCTLYKVPFVINRSQPNVISPHPFVPHNVYTPLKSNLYLANSLAAAVSEPALYRLLTFHVLISCSSFVAFVVAKHQSKSEARVHFPQQSQFLRRGVVKISPNPQAGGQPLVGCPRLLIQYIRSYPSYRRPPLHPQPEDAPCCGDRDHLSRSS